MFDKVLIANRGAIACRIIRTLRRMGIGSVAVYSEADRAFAACARRPTRRSASGRRPPPRAICGTTRILEAARATRRAGHPPRLRLPVARTPTFAEACDAAGIAFIGPTPEQMRDFGLKHTARALAREQRRAAAAGHRPAARTLRRPRRREAARIGYPVMLKSTAGGGGIGMQLCRDSAEELDERFRGRRAARAEQFQRWRAVPREVRRAARATSRCRSSATARGNVIALGERDCSVQRRNQKVIEETPAPGLPTSTRARAARRGGAARAARWTTAPPARSSSSTTRDAASSTSSR